MKFSVVIPVFNEKENLNIFFNELFDVLENNNKNFKNIFEILFVNDGSTDNSLSILKSISDQKNTINLINLDKNYGQSFALYHGVKNAKYDNIITIDADCQNNPNDIPKLIEKYSNNDKIKLVGGLRLKRKDTLVKIISSRLANKIRSFILKDKCKDTGCSLKIFDRKIFLQFNYFSGLHRFLPALYLGYGYETCFLEVTHRKRLGGTSKYGTLSRMFVGIYHLIYIYILLKRKNFD